MMRLQRPNAQTHDTNGKLALVSLMMAVIIIAVAGTAWAEGLKVINKSSNPITMSIKTSLGDSILESQLEDTVRTHDYITLYLKGVRVWTTTNEKWYKWKMKNDMKCVLRINGTEMPPDSQRHEYERAEYNWSNITGNLYKIQELECVDLRY